LGLLKLNSDDARGLSVTEVDVKQQLAELLGRISKLTTMNLEPPQFFANYLQLTVAATGSEGGGIWLIQPEQAPQCYCHIELEKTGINNDEGQRKIILEAISRTVSDDKPLVVPAAGSDMSDDSADAVNSCRHAILFKPLHAGNQVAMVLQLVAQEGLNTEDIRIVIGLLGQIAETAETFLAHRRALVLEDDRKVLAQLLKYSEGIHNSLDINRVIYQLANLGRDALGCERVVVWVDPNYKRGLIAVSGIDKPDKRAVLIQAIEKLSRHCLELKKPILGSREQLDELDQDEPLTGLLREYFNVSQLNEIFLHPLKQEEQFIGVIAVEGFEEQASANLAGVVGTIANHGSIALQNALAMDAVPLIKPLAKLRQVKADPKRRRKWTISLVAIILLLALGALWPWTIKIEGDCELRPKYQRVVDSPLDGTQVLRVLRNNGDVARGEVLIELNDAELLTMRAEKDAELAKEKAIRPQGMSERERKINELRQEQIQNQIALIDLQIEQTKLKAPISGILLTSQNDMQKLEGITVTKGDPLCEIADLSRWQLVMDVPQEEIGWVFRGLKDRSGDENQVDFFLAAYPRNKLQCGLASGDQISQMPKLVEAGNVYEIRIDVSNELLQQLGGTPRSGSTGQAKISTCKRPLGYVLLRKVIRFFRVTFF
jgi:hypothetical protein